MYTSFWNDGTAFTCVTKIWKEASVQFLRRYPVKGWWRRLDGQSEAVSAHGLYWGKSLYQKPLWLAPPQTQNRACGRWTLCEAGHTVAAPMSDTGVNIHNPIICIATFLNILQRHTLTKQRISHFQYLPALERHASPLLCWASPHNQSNLHKNQVVIKEMKHILP